LASSSAAFKSLLFKFLSSAMISSLVILIYFLII
jgi:hypothetical protein